MVLKNCQNSFNLGFQSQSISELNYSGDNAGKKFGDSRSEHSKPKAIEASLLQLGDLPGGRNVIEASLVQLGDLAGGRDVIEASLIQLGDLTEGRDVL